MRRDMRVTGIFLLLSYFSVISQSYTKYSSTALTYPKTKGLLMSQSNLERADLLHQVASMAEKIEMLSRENAQLRISAASPPANFYAIEYPPFPAWYEDIKSSSDYSVVDEVVREWNDENWRLSEGGFSGTDFVHSRSRAPVRVLEYLIIHRSSVGREPSTDLNDGLFYPSLVGPAYFSPAAESHKGLCHGGSMCALMDDAIGWMGFCISGRPKEWTGFTVQIDTSLKKSVSVGSLLKLEAWIERREGTRKVWICSKLTDPLDGTLHCSARGLFLLSPEALVDENFTKNVRILNPSDDTKNQQSKL